MTKCSADDSPATYETTWKWDVPEFKHQISRSGPAKAVNDGACDEREDDWIDIEGELANEFDNLSATADVDEHDSAWDFELLDKEDSNSKNAQKGK
jgi:hypothetical protein